MLNQRVKSWDHCLFKYTFIYIKLLFQDSLFSNIIMKLFIIHELWTQFIDLQRFPIMIYVIYNSPISVFIFLSIIYSINIILVFWFNYITLFEYFNKSNLLSILLYPIYKFLILFFRLFGELRYLFIYGGTKSRYPILIQNLPEILGGKNINVEEIEWNKLWNKNGTLKFDDDV